MPVVRNPQFYFREGICWTDVSYDIKCRRKGKSVNDVLSMALYTKTESISEKYLICLINSKPISLYVCNFINNTSHFQINDARQLPIVVPTQEQLQAFEAIFDRAYNLQVEKFTKGIDNTQALESLQNELNAAVLALYSCNDL